MDLVIVQSTNALLESQKALVDFCTFNPAKNQKVHQEVQNQACLATTNSKT
jgi:hypothetical protein